MSLLRVASLAVGAVDLVMVGVQWITGPAGKAFAVMGAVITLPTIYAGFAVLGILAVLYGGWPLIEKRRAATVAAEERERNEIIELLETARDEDLYTDGGLGIRAEQARANAEIAKRRLAAMGFGVPIRPSGDYRGLPGDWKLHAAQAIAFIEAYGVQAARDVIAAAHAEAEARVGGRSFTD